MPRVKKSDDIKPVPYLGFDLDGDDEIDTVGVIMVDENGEIIHRLQRYASEIAANGLPTQNDDGTSLAKYQSLIILDTGDYYTWNGSEWVVMP
jgi:hypothetical protein